MRDTWGKRAGRMLYCLIFGKIHTHVCAYRYHGAGVRALAARAPTWQLAISDWCTNLMLMPCNLHFG